jgi:hypothetical protein
MIDPHCFVGTTHLSKPIPTQGNIKVTSQPGGQRDVPASPELHNVPAQIRSIEVFHEFKSEDPCDAACNVGVSGEVSINLEGECVNTCPQVNIRPTTSVVLSTSYKR